VPPASPWAGAAEDTLVGARRRAGSASPHPSRTSEFSALAAAMCPPRSVDRCLHRPKLDLIGCPSRVMAFTGT
jgi:hypothetical protein